MEADDEIKGTKNSYDFGARMYDPRVGRFLSIDPKAGKYPMDSPYMGFGNNPIIFIDPDGEEKIVVVGSENRKWNLTFVLPGMKAARELKKIGGDEQTTLLLFKAGYSDGQMKRIQKYMNKNGIKVQTLTSADDLVNYINNKSITKTMSGRPDDPITTMEIYAHGKPGEIMFGYHQEAKVEDKYRFKKEHVTKVSKSAFREGAVLTSFACRTGAGKNVDDVTVDTDPENSMAQEFADHAGITVWAYQCRSEYGNILPTDFLQSVGEKLGIVDPDNTYKKDGGTWDTNGAIDAVSYPSAGSTPFASPGMTMFKKGKNPVVHDQFSDFPTSVKEY